MKLRLIGALVAFVCTFSNEYQVNCNEWAPPNTDGWVDPDDIFLHNKLKEVRKDNVNDACKDELKSCIKTRSECQKSMKEAMEKVKCNQTDSEQKEPPSSHQYCEKPTDDDSARVYLKRFVKMLLKMTEGNVRHMNEAVISLVVSSDHITALKNFGEGTDASLRRLDETLSEVFAERTTFMDISQWSITNYLIDAYMSFSFSLASVNWAIIYSVLVPSASFVFISLKTGRLLIGFTSFVVTGLFSSFLITAFKMMKEVSNKCSPKKNPSDVCDIPPNLQVTFTSVITQMFGETFNDIAKHVGAGVTKFVSEFREFGILEKIWALPFALVVTAILLAAVFGTSLQLPYSLGLVNFRRRERVPDETYNNSLSTQPSAQPSIAPQTNNFTFNFNRGEEIADVKHILHSVRQQTFIGDESQEEVSSSFRSLKLSSVKEQEEKVGSFALKKCQTLGADNLSAGDAASSSNQLPICPIEVTNSHELSSQEIYKFTAPHSNSRVWGKYKSGKPPKKVQILERTRHKSL